MVFLTILPAIYKAEIFPKNFPKTHYYLSF
jgi:hypothetical protein